MAVVPVEAALVEHQSLAERTGQALMGDILEGRLGEGGSLPSARQLAARYGVSVIVIREALAHVEARGGLERRQGRRARVIRPDPSAFASILRLSAHHDDIPLDEFLDCRIGLEVQAAVLAARRAKPEAMGALREALEGMRRARGEKSFNDHDVAFHVAVTQLSENRPIQLMLGAIRDVIRQGLTVTYSQVRATRGREGIAQARMLHERVADAILAGDPHEAAAAMAAHFAYLGHPSEVL